MIVQVSYPELGRVGQEGFVLSYTPRQLFRAWQCLDIVLVVFALVGTQNPYLSLGERVARDIAMFSEWSEPLTRWQPCSANSADNAETPADG